MVLLSLLVVICTCSAFWPRFLFFFFPLCFSPSDLHLYITVTGRVPSLNAPSIFTTFVILTFVPNLLSTRTRTSWNFLHLLRHSHFHPLLVLNPTDTISPYPPNSLRSSRHGSATRVWLSRSSSDRVRRVSLTLATRGDLKEATLFFLTYFPY